eukprot:40630_1
MSTWQLSLALLLFIVIILHGNDIRCGPGSCQDTQTCQEEEDCNIYCDGEHACQFATLLCPQDYKCTVTCNNSFACSNATINASSSSELSIIDGCRDSNTCTFLDIYCPQHNDTTKRCTISGNDNIRTGVHYYAVHGFADIAFIYSGNYTHTNSIMFCSSDYSHSCTMPSHSFTCDTNADTTCNNGIPYISTTNLIVSSTVNPTVSTHTTAGILPELGSIHILGFNIHLLWIVIAGLIVLILCIGCCLIFFIRQSRHSNRELKQRNERMMQLSKVRTLSADPFEKDESADKVSARDVTVTLASVPEVDVTDVSFSPPPQSTATSNSKQTISKKSNSPNSPRNAHPRVYTPKRCTSVPVDQSHQMNLNHNGQRPYSFAAKHGQGHRGPEHSNSSSYRRQMAPRHAPSTEHSNSSSRRKQMPTQIGRQNTAPLPRSKQSRSQTYSSPPRPHVYVAQPNTPQTHPRAHNMETSSQSHNSHSHNSRSRNTQPVVRTTSTQLIQRQIMQNSAPQHVQNPQPHAPPIQAIPAHAPAGPFKMTAAELYKISDRTETDSEAHSDKSSGSSSTASGSGSSNSSSSGSSSESDTDDDVKQETIPAKMRIQVEDVALNEDQHRVDANVREKKNKIPLQNAMQYLANQKNLGVDGSNMAVVGSALSLDDRPTTPSQSYSDAETMDYEEDTMNSSIPIPASAPQSLYGGSEKHMR